MSGQRNQPKNTLSIPYSTLPLFNTKWPLVDIGLSFKNRKLSQPTLALVDSGASNSILHPEIAMHLGFHLNKLPKQSGGNSASGQYNYWILPKAINASLFGCEFLFEFQVIDSKVQMWPCILGHDTIFRIARVAFETFNNKLEINFRNDIN